MRSLVHSLEQAYDSLKADLAGRLGLGDTPMVAPYRGFGTADSFWARGRVLEDEGVVTAQHTDSLLVNLRHTIKRYGSDEIPGARLSWEFGGEKGEVVTDEEGYFDLTFAPGDGFDAHSEWQDVHVLLEAAPHHETQPLGATVKVRTPRDHARFAVVSDIDDTIVYTGAHDFAKHWRTVVANSAKSREGYEGLPELYRDLVGDDERNPIFYVSSSPWNLFDLFERYMILNDIPVGPMLLKDFGLDDTKWLTGGHDGHKGKQIDRVAETYPDLPLILVGDSGQRDASIYADAVERHGKRIAAVLIHEVTPQEHEKETADMRARLTDTPYLVTGSYPYAHDWLRELGFADGVRADGHDTVATA